MIECLVCEKATSNPRFCSRSCAASFNNREHPKRKARECKSCPACGKKVSGTYCDSVCRGEYNWSVCKAEMHSIDDWSAFQGKVKKYLIETQGERCAICFWSTVHPVTGRVPVQLDHIDGNSENNLRSNFRLLCPNCHALTPTFAGLNRGKGRSWRRERYKKKDER